MIITETISMSVISSNKITLENIIPKIEVVEYNRMVFTPPNNFNAITKNNVSIPVPANTRTDMGTMSFRLMLNGMSEIAADNEKIQPIRTTITDKNFINILSYFLTL